MAKKELLDFLSNIGVGGCIGVIVDYIAHTSFVFTLTGLIAGFILALMLKTRKNTKGENENERKA